MLFHLEPVPGIEQGGKLHLAGPNIMKGYLLADNPGQLVPPCSERYGEGWYDTGDIVDVDEDGFLHIKGRSKRFAKISGEMVSLTAVEQLAIQTWPDAHHVAVSLPDPKKGEQVILLTTQAHALPKQLAEANPGVATILLPRKVLIIEKPPLLASGKTDYTAAGQLAAQLISDGQTSDE